MSLGVIRPQPASEPGWDLYSLTIVLVFAFFAVLQWPHLPRSIDMYYHLSVMEGFDRAGGYCTTAFWECAPVGRPHLYPPLLHLLMLALKKTGLDVISIGRLVDGALPPLVIGVLWQFSRRIFTARAAFFVVLLWGSVYSLYLSSFIYPANSLAFVLGMTALLFFYHKNYCAASIMTSLVFYTHGFMGWFILLAVLIHECLGNTKRAFVFPCRRTWLTVFSVLVMALPLLWHQAANREAYSGSAVEEDNFLQFNLAVYLLCIPGAYLAFKRKGGYFIPVALSLAMLPLCFIHPSRFVSGYGMAGLVLLAVFSLDAIYEKALSRRGQFLILTMLALTLWNPVLNYDSAKRAWSVQAPASTLMKAVYFPDRSDTRLATIYFSGPVKEISNILRRCSNSGDILWCNLNYPGAMIAALNRLATSTSTMAEVRAYRSFDPLASAKLLLWFKDPITGAVPRDAISAAVAYHLQKVGETDIVVIYINPAGGSERIQKPAVLWVLLLILGGLMLVALIFFSLKKKLRGRILTL